MPVFTRVLVATLTLAAACATAEDPSIPRERLVRAAETSCPGGVTLEQGVREGFVSNGQARRLRVELPDMDEFAGPNPVYVLFTSTGASVEDQIGGWALEQYLDAGMVILVLGAAGNGTIWPWWDALRAPGDEDLPNADLAFFDDALDCLAASTPIDANRIYVGGGSAGGSMANYVLQRRSALLAGGDVRSGMFALTSPADHPVLDPMAVIVSWGGSNDRFSGTIHGVTVSDVDFERESEAASNFWESQPGMQQVHCRGHELGHTWNRATHLLIRDFLLAHAKGAAPASHYRLPALPDDAPVTCSEAAFEAPDRPPPRELMCARDTSTGCASYCQTIGECLVDNDSVRGPLARELGELGFGGDDLRECGGCLERCDEDVRAGSAADPAVLDCVTSAMAGAACAPTIAGVQPFIDAFDGCCEGQAESAVCRRFCEVVTVSTVASSFFPACGSVLAP